MIEGVGEAAAHDDNFRAVEVEQAGEPQGEEVDFVIEAGGKLLPVEVKSTTKPRLADCAHLRTFRTEYGAKARAGLLLHTGSTLEWLAPDVLAAPWWRVL